MATAKVILNGTTLMDVTSDTVDTVNLLSGETATKNDGTSIIGAYVALSTYTVTKNLTNVTTTNDDSEILSGGSFFMDLAPARGHYIDSITVTMGGIDVTSQVFTPGVGEKTITANGTYDATLESFSGYSTVTVSVPNSYSSSDEGKVVSSGALVSQTSASYTSNGTYDTTTVNSVTVNVSGGTYPTWTGGSY